MRLIARLDIKNEFVIKGIQLEGLRKIGDPMMLAEQYYHASVDEIIFMDAVASLYGRNNLFHIVKAASKEIFIPMTLGGGIRNFEDIKHALDAGADKVAINTAAVQNPAFIQHAAERYGSQCIVGSIEAKRVANSQQWLAYIDNGREKTALDVVAWAEELVSLGAGEILLTSVDQEGTQKGFDIKLAEMVDAAVSVPVILSGGLGHLKHLEPLKAVANLSAIACASVLHYHKISPQKLREALQ